MKLTLSNISLAAQVRPGRLGGAAASTLAYSNFTEQSITPYVHQIGFTCTGLDVSGAGTDTITIGWALTSNAQNWTSVQYATNVADWTRNGDDFTYTWNTYPLLAGTTYYWKIFGTDYDTGSAVSIISAVQNFTTAYILAAPTNLTVSIVQDGATALLRAPSGVSYSLTQDTVGLRAPSGLTYEVRRPTAPSNITVAIVQDGVAALLRAPSGLSYSLTQDTVGLRSPSGLSVSLTQNTPPAFAGLTLSNMTTDYIEFDDWNSMTMPFDRLDSPGQFEGKYLKYDNWANMQTDIKAAFDAAIGISVTWFGNSMNTDLAAYSNGMETDPSTLEPIAYVYCGPSGSTVTSSSIVMGANAGAYCLPVIYRIDSPRNAMGPIWAMTILHSQGLYIEEPSDSTAFTYTMEAATVIYGSGTGITQTGVTAEGQQAGMLTSVFTLDQS